MEDFKSEYLERQIYERLLKSEPYIVKLSESKSDLSKLSTLSEPLVEAIFVAHKLHLQQQQQSFIVPSDV